MALPSAREKSVFTLPETSLSSSRVWGWWSGFLRKTKLLRGKEKKTEESSTSHDDADAEAKNRVYRDLIVGDFPLVILVHQYSLTGGNSALMHGKALYLAKHGVPTLTFDMRGVGKSSGRASFTGEAEVFDVEGVCQWAIDTLQASNVFLAGIRAGASISGSVLDSYEQIKGWIGIGYSTGLFANLLLHKHFERVLNSPKPKLFIHPGADTFVTSTTFENFYQKAQEPRQKAVILDVSIFELEHMELDAEICGHILEFIMQHSKPPPPIA